MAVSRLVSGEGVELDVRTAGVASRVLALMLDMLLQLALYLLLLGVVTGFVSAVGPAADRALLQGLSIVMAVVVLVGYPTALETLAGGRTIGKLALGLRVVRDDGGPIRFRHALTRSLVGVAVEWPGLVFPVLTWIVSLATMLANPRGKRLGDLAAGTIVVHERTPAAWGWVPAMPPPLARWAMLLDLTGLDDELALAVRHFLARNRQLSEPARTRLGLRARSRGRRPDHPAPAARDARLGLPRRGTGRAAPACGRAAGRDPGRDRVGLATRRSAARRTGLRSAQLARKPVAWSGGHPLLRPPASDGSWCPIVRAPEAAVQSDELHRLGVVAGGRRGPGRGRPAPGSRRCTSAARRRSARWRTSGSAVRNRQPLGGLTGLGTSPVSRIRLRVRSLCGSGSGIAEISACVYGCAALVNSSSTGRGLHDPAEVHDRDPVGDVPDHRQVVRDEQVGQAELLLQVLQQVDDAGLDRHVQRRHRLVEDQHLRPQRERAGDADALPLAAGELVRVPVAVLRVEPDRSQQLPDLPAPGSSLPNRPWMRSGSATISLTVIRGSSEANGSWNTICRSRRSGRICPRRQLDQVPAPVPDLPDGGLDQLEQQPAGRGLAAAGLADQRRASRAA